MAHTRLTGQRGEGKRSAPSSRRSGTVGEANRTGGLGQFNQRASNYGHGGVVGGDDGVMFEDPRRAVSFGDDAERYHRARPGYPAALYDDLVVDGPGAALDVGCGTGIAAGPLVDRGWEVLGVEPDPRMAHVARSNGVEVEVARFEQWERRGRVFDVLVCGQAWHWVDPAVAVPRVAEVLRPGGRFGVFWNHPRHDAQLDAGFERVYAQLAPGLLVDSVPLGTSRPFPLSDTSPFRAAGTFSKVEYRSYRWERRYTTEAWLDELPTHSDHRRLGRDILSQIVAGVAALIETLGGEIVVSYTTSGVFGQRG